jgi:hypothetical protein
MKLSGPPEARAKFRFRLPEIVVVPVSEGLIEPTRLLPELPVNVLAKVVLA